MQHHLPGTHSAKSSLSFLSPSPWVASHPMVDATAPDSPGADTGNGNQSNVPTPIWTGALPNRAKTPPSASATRPSPVRSFTVSNPYLASVKGRATSQPPGNDRLPNSSPGSGRGSPGMNGGEYGVIGGSRTPTSGRVSGSGQTQPVPVMRASSFSVADKVDQKVSSLRRIRPRHVSECVTYS